MSMRPICTLDVNSTRLPRPCRGFYWSKAKIYDIIAQMQTFDVNLRLGGHEYRARLEDKPATRKLKSGCPWRLTLDDLDRVAKFCYLDGLQLPTDARRPENIKTGQLYLFEENCLVLFIEDCRTTYRYTYLGEILNPEKLRSYAGYHQTELEIRAI